MDKTIKEYVADVLSYLQEEKKDHDPTESNVSRHLGQAAPSPT